MRRLRQANNGLRGHRLLIAHAEPALGLRARAPVGQIGLAAVANKEEIAEHRHLYPLLALAQKRGHRQPEELTEQIEQRRLDGRKRMHGNT